jgi:hypothetical protein
MYIYVCIYIYIYIYMYVYICMYIYIYIYILGELGGREDSADSGELLWRRVQRPRDSAGRLVYSDV